jgi:hypothetical protein
MDIVATGYMQEVHAWEYKSADTAEMSWPVRKESEKKTIGIVCRKIGMMAWMMGEGDGHLSEKCKMGHLSAKCNSINYQNIKLIKK